MLRSILRDHAYIENFVVLLLYSVIIGCVTVRVKQYQPNANVWQLIDQLIMMCYRYSNNMHDVTPPMVHRYASLAYHASFAAKLPTPMTIKASMIEHLIKRWNANVHGNLCLM